MLIKDQDWSERLSKYAALLPGLQRGLPVADEYKTEEPGTDSELNAYDVIYVAGDSSAGSKTIAINLPNDPEVQLAKGARRLQLKNAMQAKFDKILVPIADMLIAEEQRGLVSFDAFFANTMFHEVAHGLGIKNTITGSGTVREAMQEHKVTVVGRTYRLAPPLLCAGDPKSDRTGGHVSTSRSAVGSVHVPDRGGLSGSGRRD